MLHSNHHDPGLLIKVPYIKRQAFNELCSCKVLPLRTGARLRTSSPGVLAGGVSCDFACAGRATGATGLLLHTRYIVNYVEHDERGAAPS